MRMADKDRIAEVYARCLLELMTASPDGGRAVERDLDMLAAVCDREPRFGTFLISPYFSHSAKQEMVHSVFGGKVDRMTLNFLNAVIDHRREAVLPQMIDRCRRLSRARRGHQTVKVTVAENLSAEEQARLSNDLATALNAQVELDVHVDPSIVGGVVIRYADRKVDNSIRGRLHHVLGEIRRLQQRHKAQL